MDNKAPKHRYKLPCSSCGKLLSRPNTNLFLCSVCRQTGYPREFTYKAKLLRENNCCSCCEIKEDLIVHHKDNDKKNSEDSNLMVLCRSCHSALHRMFGKEYDESVFALVEIKYGEFGSRLSYAI